MKLSSHATSLSGRNVTGKGRKLAEKYTRVTANPNMTKSKYLGDKVSIIFHFVSLTNV